MTTRRFPVAALAFIAVMAFAPLIASACPNCREAMADEAADNKTVLPSARPLATDPMPLAVVEPGPSGDTPKGYAYSIYLMIAVPYTFLAAGGFGIYYFTRNRGSGNSAV
ncbi:MAG: hypothetical protein K8S99_18165 [Planctomycetes bacterium]|nr:hypothetical protein [Planctomycetota bacterium]